MRKQLNRRNVAVAFDLDFQHATEIFEGIRDFLSRRRAVEPDGAELRF